ncbi:MAG: site-specific integrase [Nocardioides sp.]|jgi:integrase
MTTNAAQLDLSGHLDAATHTGPQSHTEPASQPPASASHPAPTGPPATPNAQPRPRSTKRRTKRRTHDGGSIDRLPSGRYRVRYYADDLTTRHTRTFTSRRDASDFLATIRTDRLRGEWRDPRTGARPLGEYAASYLATRTDLRPSTRLLYARTLRVWITRDITFTPAAGGRPRTLNLGTRHLRTLTVADIREWHAAVTQTIEANLARRAERRAQPRKPPTDAAHARAYARSQGHAVAETGKLPAHHWQAWRAAGSPQNAAPERRPSREPGTPATPPRQAYALLRLVLNNAVRDGLIPANPCQIPGAGNARPAERTIPSPEQVEALAAHMPEHLRVSIILAAYSGLRVGELFALARRDVDLATRTLRVRRTLVRTETDPVAFGPPKTDAGRRTVHIPASVATQLRDHMTTFVADDPDALLFTTSNNGPLPASRRTEHFRRARRRAGVSSAITWHSLRHYAATQYARTGATTRDLQARLGHSTVVAAMIYQHTDADRDRALTELLDNLRPGNPSNVHPLTARTA